MAEPLINQELRRLAVGALHLLYGRATTDFPTSTRAHPSYLVVVQMNSAGPIKDGYEVYFPYQVIWFVWESCIFPVLYKYWGQNLAGFGWDTAIELLMREIQNRLIKQGLWPEDAYYTDPDVVPDGSGGLIDGAGQIILESGGTPGLYGNSYWLRLHLKLPEDVIPRT